MLEAAGIGIDVLNVEALVGVLTAAGDDRDVQDVLGWGSGAGAPYSRHPWLHDWRQVGSERGSLKIGEHMVSGGAAAVAHDPGRSRAPRSIALLSPCHRAFSALDEPLEASLPSLRTKVSSASTMPLTAVALALLAVARKR